MHRFFQLTDFEMTITFMGQFADNKSTTLLGLELTWFVLISVSCFLAIGAVMAGFVICICRHNPNSSDNQMQCEY